MYLKIFQKGFNYSQDGQGNRLVYHLQGCNMHCAWCANPEGMPAAGVLMTDQDWLKEELCPLGAVKNGKLDRLRCGQCKEHLCLLPKYKSKGIRCSFEAVTVQDVFAEIMSSSPMFYDGGGVTFTGGEATVQFEAVKEILVMLHEAGIHTAMETNGSHPALEELFPYIDQLIMDCKHWDADKHLKYTGVPIDIPLSNLKKATKQCRKVDVRTPVIGGINDSEEDFKQFIVLYKQIAGDAVTFELLKYHEFGRNKWAECGLSYEMGENAHVTMEQMNQFRQMIVDSGLNYKKS